MPPAPENYRPKGLHVILLIGTFLLSRAAFYAVGIRFDYTALTEYWQYPDIEILRHHLLTGLWYQSAQPPLFNFFLGALLKIHPAYPSFVFPMSLMIISLVNALLICDITARITSNQKLSLFIAIIYLLAPATILFENELFYTSFISMLFLVSALFITKWFQTRRLVHAFYFFLSLALICLSRSFFHLAWMALVVVLLIIKSLPAVSIKKLALVAVIPVLLVTAWYAKNYFLFGTFSASSWTGMNLARLVFHDKIIDDSSSVASIPPFYPVSSYERFPIPLMRDTGSIYEREFKEGRNVNMFNGSYIRIARLYEEASRKEIMSHPADYMKNVSKAWLIYFTPASSYFKIATNEKKIVYYDAVTSLNFSTFFDDKSAKKKSLVISSIVMISIFALMITFFMMKAKHPDKFSGLNYFILITIIYSILVSSFFEYGDNMRFRYEVQPLFLILIAQYILRFINGRTKSIPSYHT